MTNVFSSPSSPGRILSFSLPVSFLCSRSTSRFARSDQENCSIGKSIRWLMGIVTFYRRYFCYFLSGFELRLGVMYTNCRYVMSVDYYPWSSSGWKFIFYFEKQKNQILFQMKNRYFQPSSGLGLVLVDALYWSSLGSVLALVHPMDKNALWVSLSLYLY